VLSTHLARILRSFPVTGAHHLVVDYNVYAVGLVPPLALSVVDDWYVDGLERLRPQSRTCVAKITQKQQQNTVYYRQTIYYFLNILHNIFECRSACDLSVSGCPVVRTSRVDACKACHSVKVPVHWAKAIILY